MSGIILMTIEPCPIICVYQLENMHQIKRRREGSKNGKWFSANVEGVLDRFI
jgi:hypothetical protein